MREEDILIPKMQRLDKKQRKIHIPVLNVLLVFAAILFMVASTFVNIHIKHYFIPGDAFSGGGFETNNFIYNFYIIPQIPALMFICAVLGRRMASSAVILYILLGLVYAPIFALGGGIGYIKEYSFGYILAYIPAVTLAGHLLKNKYSFKNMILASIIGVLVIHLTGIIYMILVALIKSDGLTFITGWIQAQSGLKIVYDLVISFLAILIGKYIRPLIVFITT